MHALGDQLSHWVRACTLLLLYITPWLAATMEQKADEWRPVRGEYVMRIHNCPTATNASHAFIMSRPLLHPLLHAIVDGNFAPVGAPCENKDHICAANRSCIALPPELRGSVEQLWDVPPPPPQAAGATSPVQLP